MVDSAFALALCQPGMERALKAELARLRPDLHPGFQRPGLVTFKATARGFGPGDAPQAIYARMWAASGGSLTNADAMTNLARNVGATKVFVGPRDIEDEGPPAALAAIEAEVSRWQARLERSFGTGAPQEGEVVLDVVVAPGESPTVGWHVHGKGRHEGPSGAYVYPRPDDLPSRAWRKVKEGLRWSGVNIRPGELVLELGAAPGGGTRAFVEAGARVLAVDPQPLAPEVLALPGVQWLGKSSGEIKLATVPPDVAWLACDAGIPPNDVLRSVERLLPAVRGVKGFLYTLKLQDDGVVKHLPGTLAKLQKLFGKPVRARQLPANRRDVWVVVGG